jgi:hypothetical protein
VTDIGVASRGGKIRLRGRRPASPKNSNDWEAKLSSEIGRLVEAACASAAAMERNRHDDVCAVEDLLTVLAQLSSKRPCQRSPAIVLQRVHNGAERSFVRADGATACDR